MREKDIPQQKHYHLNSDFFLNVAFKTKVSAVTSVQQVATKACYTRKQTLISFTVKLPDFPTQINKATLWLQIFLPSLNTFDTRESWRPYAGELSWSRLSSWVGVAVWLLNDHWTAAQGVVQMNSSMEATLCLEQALGSCRSNWNIHPHPFWVTGLLEPILPCVKQRRSIPLTGHQSVAGPHTHKHTYLKTQSNGKWCSWCF